MHERGLLTLSESAWAEAKKRADVIGPLAALPTVSRLAAEAAAAEIGISVRQVYKLIKRYRLSDGLVTDLATGCPTGGKGKSRIAPEIEKLISESIEQFYLTRQKRSQAAVEREVWMRCKQAAYNLPSRNTIRARIKKLDPKMIAQKRLGADAARSLHSAGGKSPEPSAPLDIVQMDHTPVDLIVVDECSREPIGRPYLTIAIDTFTRCIVGMLLTLEAPSATSVGLCLTHTVTDKGRWLSGLGLTDMTWPMHGKPGKICMDNASEFKSDALKRGCEQHGIEREYRPPGQPHFGGIVERVIGTAMKMVHELPGTTFSNTKERGDYDSEKRAILTMRELEKWLTLAIGTYHESIHSGLWETPAACWRRNIGNVKTSTVSNERAFLIDFLPVLRRNISRTGFVIDHITYYSDVLKAWIARRHDLEKFIIRRDPRDLSKVWVLDPVSSHYLEIPYRSISNPAVTLWEHRKAVEKLRESGRTQVNESVVFRMVSQMRQIAETAAAESKLARRDKARRKHLNNDRLVDQLTSSESPGKEDFQHVNPFDDIEEW
ncbi:MAG TPA: DDE-type integrase/transposase/recombinase [Oculatellaceae cyanobacterium]